MTAPVAPSSGSLRAQVGQLRRDVARTADQLAKGAVALEQAQARHAALIQAQSRASQGVDAARTDAWQSRTRLHMLARQAYMGSALPALPLVLTRDLGAVANLAYLHRSLDRVGAEQQQV
ncbi:MAG: hypothetical protein H7323_08665, partial [Frankiales bacterium]|nr:hypothetical protein [Frankiales bacterium]